MISGITIENVRGVTGSLELDQHTIITGPMASGKSAYPVGLDFIMFGYVPGSKPSEMFNNALGDTMYAKATVSDRVIERWMTKGKTLSEELAVDGNRVKLSKGNDKAMLQMALGKAPKLFDVQAFWNATGPERRKMVLGMVTDPDKVDELLTAEKDARADVSLLAADRRAADQAVSQLSRELAEMEKPSGDLTEIEEQLETLQMDLDAARDRVRTGEANDRARAAIASSKDTLPTLEARLLASQKDAEALAEQLCAAQDALKDHKDDEPTLEEGEYARWEITPIVRTVLEEVRDDIGAVVKELVANEHLDRAYDRLGEMIGDPEKEAEWAKQRAEWDNQNQTLANKERQLASQIDAVGRDISSAMVQITACKETIAKEEAIGPGLDQNDVASAEGFEARKKGLEASAHVLRKMKIRQDDIEQAKINAGKAAEQEKVAKEAIDTAVEAQRKVVSEVEDMLAKRSKEFLPYGNLRVLDEGKKFDLLWAKDADTRVSRSTLSGGEQCLFDAAVARILAPEAAVVMEAAEIDDEVLVKFLGDTANADYQIIILTCHEPPTVPDGWKHIKMNGNG